MQEKLLEYLCCPDCRGSLDPTIFQTENRYFEEIIEGILFCKDCEIVYPVIDGVPRMLPTSLADNREFLSKHADRLDEIKKAKNFSAELLEYKRTFQPTADSFGFEWNKYKVTTREEDFVTFFGLTGVDPLFYQKHEYDDIFTYYPTREDLEKVDTSFLESRLVLDVGCGMGKYTDLVSDLGAEVVGLDLSLSLLRAREKTRHKPNVHLVQGNIFFPPLKRDLFDFIFSVGVLHHTPNTERAFKEAASLVKPGGRFSIWVYPSALIRYERISRFIQDDVLRPVLRRLPHKTLYQVCRVLGAMVLLRGKLLQAHFRGRYRLERLLGLVAVGMHTDIEIASFLNFDWYSPQYRFYHSEQEVLKWFEDAGFKDITMLRNRLSATAVKRKVFTIGPVSLIDVDYSRKNSLIGGESLRVDLDWMVNGNQAANTLSAAVTLSGENGKYSSETRVPGAGGSQRIEVPVPEDALTGRYGIKLEIGHEGKSDLLLQLGDVDVINKAQNDNARQEVLATPLEDTEFSPKIANFENRVLLRGIKVSAPVVHRGGVWSVVFAWHTLIRPEGRLVTGVYLMDAAGSIAFSVLQYTRNERGLWFHRPGISFVELVNLLIPKTLRPGKYKACVGLRHKNYRVEDDHVGTPAHFCVNGDRRQEFFELCEIEVV
jgi:SAM-dependent methyltransferase/uncharacterized protein YbaR (Trm112 family)